MIYGPCKICDILKVSNYPKESIKDSQLIMKMEQELLMNDA